MTNTGRKLSNYKEMPEEEDEEKKIEIQAWGREKLFKELAIVFNSQ